MKPDLQDLQVIKNKLYWDRLNSQSQLSKIRKTNPTAQSKKAVVKTKTYQDTKAHQQQKKAIFKRIGNRIELQEKYDNANIDLVNGVTPPLDDTRSTTERLKDDFSMRKIALENAQTLFGDKEEAGAFMGLIQMDSNVTRFFVQHFPQIYRDLKDKTNLIDALYVKRYLDKYAEKIAVTSGVDDIYTSASINALLPNKNQFRNLILAIQNISPPNAQVMIDIQDILARLEAFQIASASASAMPTGSTLPTAIDFTTLIDAINNGDIKTQDLLKQLQQTLKDVNTNSLKKLLVAQGDKSIIKDQTLKAFIDTINGSKGKYKIEEIELDKMLRIIGDDPANYNIVDKYRLLKSHKQFLQTINKIIVNSPDEDIENKLEVLAQQNKMDIDDLKLAVSNIETAFYVYLENIQPGQPVPRGDISMYLDKLISSNGGNLGAIIQPTVSNSGVLSSSASVSSAQSNAASLTNAPSTAPIPLALDFLPDIINYATDFLGKSQTEQEDIINNEFKGNMSMITNLEVYYQLSNTPDDTDKLNLFNSSGLADPNATTQEDLENDLVDFVESMNGLLPSFQIIQPVQTITGLGIRQARKTPKTKTKSTHPLLQYFRKNY